MKKYIVVLLACIFLFAQCHKSSDNPPPLSTSSFDTLGIHWTTVEGNYITYCFEDYNTQLSYAATYISEHEQAYAKINSIFNAKMPRNLHFFIWTDTALARKLLNYPLGFTDPPHCICYVRPTQSIGHEMTHAITYWGNGTPPVAITRFCNEGVAVAFDQNPVNRIDVAKAALAGQNIHSVTDLWYGSYQYASEEVFYPVAGAFMDFLYKQGQFTHFDSLIKNQTFSSAQNIYGAAYLDSLITVFNHSVGL